MKNVQLRLAVLLAPLMTLAIVLAGCGGDKDKGTGGGSSRTDKTTGDGGGGDKASGGGSKMVKGTGRGTLKGQVVFDGVPPDTASEDKALQEKMAAKDAAHCVQGASDEEKASYLWHVNPKNKGVKNVIVWLSPGEGNQFELSPEDKKPAKEKVVIRQPHCAFIPHCEVAFTHYKDGTKWAPTGQKVAFKNDAETAHNTNYKGVRTSGNNLLLKPGQEEFADIRQPDQISLSCEIHPWMKAHIRNFDHPFAAVTDDDGNFEIKNVPTGVPVQLVIWHEAGEYGPNTAKGKTVTLKDGENTENLTIKAK
jgi:hypothetical protein